MHIFIIEIKFFLRPYKAIVKGKTIPWLYWVFPIWIFIWDFKFLSETAPNARFLIETQRGSFLLFFLFRMT